MNLRSGDGDGLALDRGKNAIRAPRCKARRKQAK
jgi:hypothetical protein